MPSHGRPYRLKIGRFDASTVGYLKPPAAPLAGRRHHRFKSGPSGRDRADEDCLHRQRQPVPLSIRGATPSKARAKRGDGFLPQIGGTTERDWDVSGSVRDADHSARSACALVDKSRPSCGA